MKFKLHPPLKDMFVTQKFGENNLSFYRDMGMIGHNGIDYRAIDGTPVFASHDGRVTFAGYDGSGGLGVVIRTENEVELEGGMSHVKTIYWHLKKGSILVTGGQSVKAGQQIGEADNTGLSTGSHLHFGLKPIARGENDWTWFNLEQNNGYFGAIDPQTYLDTFIPFTSPMKYGEYSDNVATMQAFFIRIGLMGSIPADQFGWYGKKTALAVYIFMQKSGKLSLWEKLYWRGYNVGNKTLETLNEKYTT